MKGLMALTCALFVANPMVATGGYVRAQAIESSDSVKARQSEEVAETALMLSQFERSYVTSTDVRGERPHLIFEGSVAPPLYVVSPGKNLAIVATPKIVLSR
jgi:hypothetical protein